jgi:hypothetical protein
MAKGHVTCIGGFATQEQYPTRHNPAGAKQGLYNKNAKGEENNFRSNVAGKTATQRLTLLANCFARPAPKVQAMCIALDNCGKRMLPTL